MSRKIRLVPAAAEVQLPLIVCSIACHLQWLDNSCRCTNTNINLVWAPYSKPGGSSRSSSVPTDTGHAWPTQQQSLSTNIWTTCPSAAWDHRCRTHPTPSVCPEQAAKAAIITQQAAAAGLEASTCVCWKSAGMLTYEVKATVMFQKFTYSMSMYYTITYSTYNLPTCLHACLYTHLCVLSPHRAGLLKNVNSYSLKSTEKFWLQKLPGYTRTHCAGFAPPGSAPPWGAKLSQVSPLTAWQPACMVCRPNSVLSVGRALLLCKT